MHSGTPLWRIRAPNYRVVIARKGLDYQQSFDTYAKSRQQLDITMDNILQLSLKTSVWEVVSIEEI